MSIFKVAKQFQIKLAQQLPPVGDPRRPPQPGDPNYPNKPINILNNPNGMPYSKSTPASNTKYPVAQKVLKTLDNYFHDRTGGGAPKRTNMFGPKMEMFRDLMTSLTSINNPTIQPSAMSFLRNNIDESMNNILGFVSSKNLTSTEEGKFIYQNLTELKSSFDEEDVYGDNTREINLNSEIANYELKYPE